MGTARRGLGLLTDDIAELEKAAAEEEARAAAEKAQLAKAAAAIGESTRTGRMGTRCSSSSSRMI